MSFAKVVDKVTAANGMLPVIDGQRSARTRRANRRKQKAKRGVLKLKQEAMKTSRENSFVKLVGQVIDSKK